MVAAVARRTNFARARPAARAGKRDVRGTRRAVDAARMALLAVARDLTGSSPCVARAGSLRPCRGDCVSGRGGSLPAARRRGPLYGGRRGRLHARDAAIVRRASASLGLGRRFAAAAAAGSGWNRSVDERPANGRVGEPPCQRAALAVRGTAVCSCATRMAPARRCGRVRSCRLGNAARSRFAALRGRTLDEPDPRLDCGMGADQHQQFCVLVRRVAAAFDAGHLRQRAAVA